MAVLAAVSLAPGVLAGLVDLVGLPATTLLAVAAATLGRVGLARRPPEPALLLCLLLAVAVTARAAAALGALPIEVWRLLTPGRPGLLGLVLPGALIVLLWQPLLATGLLETAVLALLLLAVAVTLLVCHVRVLALLLRRP